MPSDPSEPTDAPTLSPTPELNPALARALAHGEVEGLLPAAQRIDTHLSHVFLCGPLALKLKRAVRAPFVDYSSLALRAEGCRAEVDANQPNASRLYRGALPITRDSTGRFALNGSGEPVEWAVVMRRFPESDAFDVMAKDGMLAISLVEEAAEAIAELHSRAPATARLGHAVDYRAIIEGLRKAEAHGAGELGLRPGAPTLFDALLAALQRLGPLIEHRREAGKVRRVHGDLHLRNLCLFEGKPLAFDALDFDPRLATTDVLYDLAFLLMDLRRYGLDAHANAALNRYFDAAEETEAGLAVTPFFMALRAAVRMAVAVEAGALAEAADYRRLGLELIAPAPAHLVAIGGLSGTGKSLIARGLAPRMPGAFGARILRSDVLRKRALGLKPGSEAPAQAYSSAKRAEVYTALAARAEQALAAGAPTIADATFRAKATRGQIEAAAGDHPFLGVWLEAPLAVRLARVARRVNDASDATVDVARAQRAAPSLPVGWRGIDASRASTEILGDIEAALRAPNREE